MMEKLKFLKENRKVFYIRIEPSFFGRTSPCSLECKDREAHDKGFFKMFMR